MTVAVSSTTSALQQITEAGSFAINYLSTAGSAIYDRFAAKDAPKDKARFDGLSYSMLATGSPVFADVVGAMDCTLEDQVERLGTVLLFGRIAAVREFPEARPLVHFRGGFLPQ